MLLKDNRVAHFFRNRKHYIYGILFCLSILPFLGKFLKKDDVLPVNHELFNPKLSSIQDVSSAIIYIDEKYNSHSHLGFDTVEYVQLVSDFTKNRFYHGLSHYSFSDNWIACLCGKMFWSHLSAIVSPDDILKHNEGLCSQQAIVFMDILRRKNIVTRNVGLGYKEGPGHFLAEVFYSGTWHMYDVNLEPNWKKITNHHKSVDYYRMHPDSLYCVYDGILNKTVFSKIMKKVKYGNANEFPASKMLLFHGVTLAFCYLFPAVLLIMFLIQFYKNKRQDIEKKLFENNNIRVVEVEENLA